MPLQTQLFPVEFGGVDTKSDPKKVIPGKLLALQNGTFSSPGQIVKRNGYSALPQTTAAGSIAVGAGLASYNSELLMFGGTGSVANSLYSYSPATSSWISKGSFQSVNVTTSSIVRNTYAQTTPDFAQIGNLQCFAWEDSRGGVHYSILDAVTGAALVPDAAVNGSSTVSRPKVLAFGTFFIIIVANSTGTITYYYISTTTPTVISSPQTLSASLHTTNSHYDAQVIAGRVFTAWNNTTGGVSFNFFTTPGGSLSGNTIAGDPASGCIAIVTDATNGKVSFVYSNGSAVKALVYTTAGISVTSFTVETISAVTQVTGVQTSANVLQLFYAVPGSQTYNTLTRACTVTNYVPGTATSLLRSVGLAGKAFSWNSTAYVPLAFQSPLQPTLFVADQSGNLVAKVFAGTAGGLPTRSLLCEVYSPSTGVFTFPGLVVDLLTTLPSTTSATTIQTPTFTLTGINAVSLNFTDSIDSFLSTTLGSNLHISGGFLGMYDGGQPVEHGFHVAPEGVTSQVAVFGGTVGVPSGITTANLQYAATYEWVDAQGQTHYSSPSVPNTAYLGPQLPTSTTPAIGFADFGNGVTVGPVTSSNLATSYSLAKTISQAATLSSGSTSVTVTPLKVVGGSNNVLLDYLFPGMTVSGTGVPANASVGIVSTGGINLSSAATASGASTLTLGYSYSAWGFTAASSSNATLNAVQMINVCGQTTAGSNVVTVMSTAGLVVGQTVLSAGGHIPGTYPGSTTITAINTTANTITLSANATDTTTGWVVLQVGYTSTGNTTSGSANITGCSAAAVAYAQSHIGSSFLITGSGIPANAIISSASGTTITLNTNATATATGISFSIYHSGDVNLKVGHTISSAYFPSNTVVTALGTGTATLSNPANTTNSVTAVPLVATNVYQVINSIPTLRLTAKQNARSPVSVVAYRTTGNGTIFYRSSSVTSPLYNSTTTDTVSFVDTTSDSAIVSSPQLYTTGSVLENQSPGPCSLPTTHKGRVFVVDTTNPNTLWYSQQVVSGQPVQFSAFLTMPMDPTGGAITGLASMDDRLIIFKSTAIFVVTGDGPDATGANNTFSNPVLLPTDAGCVNYRSIVMTPEGLMFQCAKGIALLSRNLAVEYIGKDVENLLTSATVTSARLVQVQNQVRFTLSNGTALVYDLLVGQWSTFTNHACVDAAFYGGNFTMLKSSGQVLTETTGVYTDNGAFIPLSLTTSWLQLAGVQGFQRIRKALVFGDYRSTHNLQVQVAYDFNTTPTQTDTIAVTSPPSGAEQFRVFMQTQKCEAIQLTLSDTQNGAAGESVRLSGITLELGIKGGPNRMPASNSVG